MTSLMTSLFILSINSDAFQKKEMVTTSDYIKELLRVNDWGGGGGGGGGDIYIFCML